MKIEKLNENQIRCTLTSDDLARRHMKMSELAYGTEKTRSLFRDMVRQADYECGFDTENIPLMIEAIPMSSDCIVLLITKVEDPEELDTRFSKFAPSLTEEAESDDPFAMDSDDPDDSDEMPLDFPSPNPRLSFDELVKDAVMREQSNMRAVLRCSTMQAIMDFAGAAGAFSGSSALYKDIKTGEYLLCFYGKGMNLDAFSHLCSLASEYGTAKGISESALGFLKEHSEVLVAKDAIKKLGGQ